VRNPKSAIAFTRRKAGEDMPKDGSVTIAGSALAYPVGGVHVALKPMGEAR